MEERERQAHEGAGGRAKASARLLSFMGVSAAVVAVALVAAAPAGGGVIAGERLAPASVTVSDFSFAPRDVTIVQGETVTWTNTQGTHNVVFDGSQPAFPESPPSANVWPYTRSFNTPGTFRYYCQPHGGPGGVGMAGTVTVTEAAPPPGGGTPPPGGGTPPPGGGTPPPGGGTPPPGGGTPPPGGGGGGGGGNPPPGGLASTTVTLKVSDTTPARGARVRFFGAVRPERDGRMLQLQRRARGGSYRTVARIRLSDAGSARSKFSKRFRVLGDAVFRARLPADSAHEAGVSRTRRLDVP
jgi:plastocyanin